MRRLDPIFERQIFFRQKMNRLIVGAAIQPIKIFLLDIFSVDEQIGAGKNLIDGGRISRAKLVERITGVYHHVERRLCFDPTNQPDEIVRLQKRLTAADREDL